NHFRDEKPENKLSLNHIVNTMNDNGSRSMFDISTYQVDRLRLLIAEMVECCEDKRILEHRKFGLPYAELKCISLMNEERYLTVKGMAQKLKVAKSRVTKIIDNLITKEMVSRISDPTDGRIKLISLTQAGRRKAEEVDAFHREIHSCILSQMTEEERIRLLADLEKLRSAMEIAKEQLLHVPAGKAA
ncbi:MarR family winged helix-turn-helix transcriptional regulator, partial [Thermodesulfobacteriota bacterium]